MRAARPVVVVIASVLLASVLLAACGSASEVDGPGNGQPQDTSCPDPATLDGGFLSGAEPDQHPLPTDVVPELVIRCVVEVRDVPGRGQWTYLVESSADHDLGPFLRALRQPDEPESGQACDLSLLLVPWFALITADGDGLRPRVPVTACKQPQAAFLETFDQLPFKVVKETRLRQIESEEAQKSGCPMQWKDMVAIEAAADDVTSTADHPVLDAPATSSARVCHYRSDGLPAEETPTGTFEAGKILKGASWAAVVADLEGAPAAKPCTTRSATFAVVLSRPDGPSVTVETGGCLRMLTESDELRQAPDSLLEALR